ncbi:MAG: MATE family efflux transporter [Chlamydiia bacterium]|nr:MATE family efflux transporter [Chlamydiia bacterium]
MTVHSPGSMGEMWTITWPIMLGLFSSGMMLFVDRLFLGHYSLKAFAACANGSVSAYIFLMVPIAMTSMSEVFAGRLHGAGQEEKIGEVVWQMVWLSFLLLPLFFLIGEIAPHVLFRSGIYRQEEALYFATLMRGSFFFFATPALSGFFSGRGKTRIIAVITLGSNGINALLDYLLIFGIGGFKEMGIQGAAYATVSAQASCVLLFALFFFFAKKNPGRFALKIKIRTIWEGIRVGFPAGLGHASEMVAHFVFFKIMERTGSEYHAIAVMMQSLYLLFNFINNGIFRGTRSLVSNFIGAKRYLHINQNIFSACKIHALFFSVLFLGVIIFGEKVGMIFLSKAEIFVVFTPSFVITLKLALIYTSLFFLLDGWMWAMIGALVAACDTKFIMMIGMIAQWVTYLIPIYIAINYFGVSVAGAWLLVVINQLLMCIVYFLRIQKAPWEIEKAHI